MLGMAGPPGRRKQLVAGHHRLGRIVVHDAGFGEMRLDDADDFDRPFFVGFHRVDFVGPDHGKRNLPPQPVVRSQIQPDEPTSLVDPSDFAVGLFGGKLLVLFARNQSIVRSQSIPQKGLGFLEFLAALAELIIEILFAVFESADEFGVVFFELLTIAFELFVLCLQIVLGFFEARFILLDLGQIRLLLGFEVALQFFVARFEVNDQLGLLLKFGRQLADDVAIVLLRFAHRRGIGLHVLFETGQNRRDVVPRRKPDQLLQLVGFLAGFQRQFVRFLGVSLGVLRRNVSSLALL